MNLSQMIAELRQERAALDEAIAVIERLSGTRRRRGRPPAWMAVAASVNGEARPRREFSAATRRKMAESQKKRWAAYRKAKESSS